MTDQHENNQYLTNKNLKLNQKEINRRMRLGMLFICGYRQNEIARILDKTAQALNNEIRGDYRSEEIRLGVCCIIGVPKEIFWPEFYGQINKENNQAA